MRYSAKNRYSGNTDKKRIVIGLYLAWEMMLTGIMFIYITEEVQSSSLIKKTIPMLIYFYQWK